MPNRIVREGILSSERVEKLDPPAEVFYRRLLSKVDDHGLYDARPSMLRASLYPLRIDRVREADCTRWLAACQMAGLIVLYEADGKPYLQVLDTKWQARSDPKYPLPTANNCKQVQATDHLDVVVVVAEDGRKAPEVPEWVPIPQWQAFVEMRAKLRKPMTAYAKKLIFKKLDGLRATGNDPAQVLEQSVRKSWQDVFELKADYGSKTERQRSIV